jgi:hypothetical protein
MRLLLLLDVLVVGVPWNAPTYASQENSCGAESE